MTEIEKLFENAGIKKAPDINNCYPEMMKCHHCKHYKVINEYTGRCLNEVYPDFTAEKQLNIFKMFCNRYLEISQHVEENGDLCFGIKTTVGDYIVAFDKDFAECLACFVNNFWLSLTDQEKEEIRGILNEI